MPKILFTPNESEAYDTKPVCFKVRKGVRDKLRNVPKWQERFRELADTLIRETEGD